MNTTTLCIALLALLVLSSAQQDHSDGGYAPKEGEEYDSVKRAQEAEKAAAAPADEAYAPKQGEEYDSTKREQESALQHDGAYSPKEGEEYDSIKREQAARASPRRSFFQRRHFG